MSCCGNNKALMCGSKGEFSPINDTWSSKSDLKMNDWDPYPELSSPLQNYNGCASGGCSTNRYENYGPNTNPNDYDTLAQSWNIQPRYSMETYGQYRSVEQGWRNGREPYMYKGNPDNNPSNFSVLNNTWSQQQRYQL